MYIVSYIPWEVPSPRVKFLPKVGISVTTMKFDKKLTYWPLAAPLFILFLHFLFAKPMKIT